MGGRVLLLWDNGTIHRRKDVKAFLWEVWRRLKTRRFPNYVPELNPDEMVCSALKDQRLPNFCPKTDDDNRERAERELRWLQRHPDFVASCIQHAKIPLGPRRGETSPVDVTISRQRRISRSPLRWGSRKLLDVQFLENSGSWVRCQGLVCPHPQVVIRTTGTRWG